MSTLQESLKHLKVGSERFLQGGGNFCSFLSCFILRLCYKNAEKDTCNMEKTFVPSSSMKFCAVEMENCYQKDECISEIRLILKRCCVLHRRCKIIFITVFFHTEAICLGRTGKHKLEAVLRYF